MAKKKATNPLMENEHVKEFLSVMKSNGKDASNLSYLIGYVNTMENQLNKAVDELAAMRRELAGMREERNHPVRTALQNTAKALETTINETRDMLNEIKEKIIEGCKNALADFKQKGVSALNGVAKFFKIKPLFEALRSDLQHNIKMDKTAIAKIEAISKQYHTIGRDLGNLGRVIAGKKTVRNIKPNGKLAKLIEAPFRQELKSLTHALKDSEKAIAALKRLEKAAPQKAVSAKRAEEKPSVRETMKTLKVQVEQKKKATPVKNRSKQTEAAI